MRLIPTSSCKSGMILGRTIFGKEKQVLLHEGATLTEGIIKRLQQMDIPLIYIHDKRTEDIEIKDVLHERTRTEALQTIEYTFRKITKDGKVVQTIEDPEFSKTFRGVIKDILADIRNHPQVMSLLVDVCAFDEYTFQHSLNVSVYSLAVGIGLGYNDQQLEELGLGAILHDIGKIVVPHDILVKKGKLTEDEYFQMKEHTTHGFNMLRKVFDLPLLVAHCAFQHHERLDGSGYPRGIRAKEIHPYAKIIAISDVYDATTSRRSYREAMLPDVAMELIYAGAGEKFDLGLVEMFRSRISMYPLGMTVSLSTGYKGVVIDHNRNFPSRPVVRLLEDEQGQEVDTIVEIDLSKELAITIKSCHT